MIFVDMVIILIINNIIIIILHTIDVVLTFYNWDLPQIT